MTDYTTTQGRLRARAAYLLKAFGSMVVHQDTMERDAVMMGAAASYIDDLERDKFALETSNKAIAEQRDFTTQSLVKVTAERDRFAEAYNNAIDGPGAVHGPVFEQVKAQIIADMVNVFGLVAVPPKPKALPRFYVDRVRHSPDPRKIGQYMYHVRDRTVKIPFMAVNKSVACSRESDTAERICDMLNQNEPLV